MNDKNPLAVKCGQRIKELREEYKLAQYELADKINVKKSVVSKYEQGESFPSPDRLVTIADYFSTSVDYLLCRTDVREYDRGESYDLRTELINKLYSVSGKLLTPAQKKEIADFAEFIVSKN